MIQPGSSNQSNNSMGGSFSSSGSKHVPKVPYMNTLTACSNKMVQSGYTDTLKVTRQGLFSTEKDKTYTPSEVKIIDFFRFEGQSDPADNSIMYVIETADGSKGLLIDAYGPYADPQVNKFMAEVEEINKKVIKGEHH